VPGNRIGHTVLSIAYLKQPLELDYLWAALCLVGAVYFAFRSQLA